MNVRDKFPRIIILTILIIGSLLFGSLIKTTPVSAAPSLSGCSIGTITTNGLNISLPLTATSGTSDGGYSSVDINWGDATELDVLLDAPVSGWTIGPRTLSHGYTSSGTKSIVVTTNTGNGSSATCATTSVTVTAPLATASCSVSPSSPMANGTNPGITLYSTNAVYCNVLNNDGTNTNLITGGSFTSGTFYPGAQTTAGSHYGQVFCFNADNVGTSWNACYYTVNPAMTGVLIWNPGGGAADNTPCTIAPNQNSCLVTLYWSTSNAEATSAITSNGSTIATGLSGYLIVSIPYGSKTFYLYNNSKSLVPSSPNGAGITVNANCDTANHYHWSGSACVLDNFSINVTTANANNGGNGSGAIFGAGTYPYNTGVILTAVADTGSTFAGWSGGTGSASSCAGTGACNFTITQNSTLTATFTLNTYTLTINTAGNGSGTVSGAGTYNYNTVVTAGATFNSTSTNLTWGGDCNGSGQVTMTSNKVCTATFTLKTNPVTITVGSGGSVSPNTTQTINYGSTASFTITPNTGYSIAPVASTCGGSLVGNVFTTGAVTASCGVSVGFNINQETLTVTKSGTGSGGISSVPAGISNCTSTCTATFSYGTSVTLTATASTGSVFTPGWGGDCSGTGTCSITMNQNRSEAASFTVNSYPLIVSKTGNGSGRVTSSPAGIDCGATCSASFNYGTSVTLTAVADTGSIFGGWSAPCSGSGTCTLDPYYNSSVTALFTLSTHTVTATSGANGTISPASQTVNYNSTATINITPSSGNYVPIVSSTCPAGSLSGTGTAYTYTTGAITASDCNVSVVFQDATTSCGSGGYAGCYTDNTTRALPNQLGGFNETRETCVQLAKLAGYKYAGLQWYGNCFAGNTLGYTLVDNSQCNTTCNSNTGEFCGGSYRNSVCNVVLMTGTLTGPASCTIASGASSCNVTLTWSVSSPDVVGGSAVTASGMTSVTGDSGSQSFAVPYNNGNGRTFFLYNNSKSLVPTSPNGGGITVASSCVANTHWNGTICTPDTYSLTVTKAGTGTGSVSSSPAGIDCGATCNATYNYNTVVILTATVASGSTFTGWSGGTGSASCTNTSGTCSVTLAQSSGITANFTLNSYTVTGTTGAGGTISTTPQTVNYGSTATFTITPPTNNGIFTPIGGTCPAGTLSGTDPGPYTYTTGAITANCNVSVTFVSGSLSAPDCNIASGASSCNTNLVWSTTNPIAGVTSAVTTSGSITVATANASVGTPYSVSYGSRIFYLYHNGVLLATTTTNATCTPNVNTWDGVKCAPVTVSVTAADNPVSYNRGTTISWSSTNATSCNSGGHGTGTSGSFSTGALTNSQTYSVTCSAANGASGSGSVAVSVGTQPTGTLNGSDCQIALNASTCNTTLTLNINNPIPGALTNITKPTNVTVVSGIVPPYPQTQTVTVSHPSTTFYLNHDGTTLNPNGQTINATCASGTIWDTTTNQCVQIINAICAATHYNCSVGTYAGGGTSNITPWNYTWTCNGSNTGTNASCTEDKPATYGTLVPATSSDASCTIPNGASRCQVNLYWSTTNPQLTSSVTSGTDNNGNVSPNFHVSSPDVNTGTQSVYVPYNSRIFYLYNNQILLNPGGLTIPSSCATNTTWNGTTCVWNNFPLTVTKAGDGAGTVSSTPAGINCGSTCSATYSYGTNVTLTATPTVTVPTSGSIFSGWSGGGCSGTGTCTVSVTASTSVTATFSLMSGTLTPTSSTCTIPVGGSSCTQTLSWTTTNPIATSAVTNNGTATPNPATGNSGSQLFTIPYNSTMSGVTTFYLYNDSIPLATALVNTNCAVNTTWNGSVCLLNSHTVTATAGTGGTITPASQSVSHGSTTTFTINPASGYSIATPVGGTCGGTLSGNTYTTNAITADCTVIASFLQMSGTLTPASSTCTIPVGGSSCTQTLSWTTTNPIATSAVTNNGTATPNPATGNSGSQLFTIPYNSTMSGVTTFYLYNDSIPLATALVNTNCAAGVWDGTKCAQYTVTGTAGNGGTITSSQTVDYNGTANLSVSANPGYFVNSVTGCGGSFNSNSNVFTTGPVTSNCTVTATFMTTPTVITYSCSNLTQTTATGGGNTAYNGEVTVTQAGLVWNTSPNPTTAYNIGITYNGWALGGAWTSNLTNLISGTTYHVRAYAINSVGTSYGSDVSCTTLPADCNVAPFGTITSGNSVTAYSTSAPTGACVSETRTCTNGTLSGSYTNSSCTAGCTGTPWGNVASGYSNTAYSSSSVTYPSACVSQTRTCTAGTLSGTYTNANCSVTAVVPTVTTTTSITNTTQTSATGGGTTVSNGGDVVTQAGLVWGTSMNPTIDSNLGITYNGWALGGPWISNLTGLALPGGTTYYVRAYAKNSAGTGYGNNVSFITPLNASCAATHYYCSAGNSANNSDNLSTWNYTWTCNGLYGGTNASCSENKPATYGTLVPASPSDASCVISSGGSACNVNLYWSTTNPQLTSSVTSGTDNVGNSSPNFHVSSPDVNTGTQSVIIPYSGRNFYLYNNSILLSGPLNIPSSCVSGTSWNTTSQTCTPPPTGTLTTAEPTPACTILSGGSSCLIHLNWTTTNPVGVSAVTASGMANVNGNSGSQAFTVPYSSRIFYLYNNAILLNPPAGLTVTASCDTNTAWDGTKCSPVTASCTITPASPISSTVNPTLILSSTNAGYCYITNDGFAVNYGYFTSGSFPLGLQTPGSHQGAVDCYNPDWTAYSDWSTCNYTVSVNGICGASHYNCDAGTSINNVDGASQWSWTCSGLYGGTSASCGESKPPTGTITATDCTIPSGGSSCSTTITWCTTNPASVSSVTTSPNITVATGNCSSTSYSIIPMSRGFYLYNNSIPLATAIANASCALGSTWNGTICLGDTHSLTITKAGAGSGTVSSSPAGINCGAICNTTYNYNTSVTLTATPNTGSTFAGWSGGGCSGTGTCVVDMTTDTSVTATFTIISYNLTVTKAGTGAGTVSSSPLGIACGATCNASYTYGTTVTLTATAGTGSTLTSWSGGGCSGTGTCVVDVTANTSVTANFNLQTPVITPSAGSGGAISPSTPQTVNYGSTKAFTLTLSPSNYSDVSIIGGTCPVGTLVGNTYTTGAITANCTVVANFMSGTLSSNPSYCFIPANSDNCSINLTFNTVNPVGISAITADGMASVPGNSGTDVSFSVPHAGRTFYLYNNGDQLAQTFVMGSCVSGTSWNGSSCGATTDGVWSAWGACSATACGCSGIQTRVCTPPQNGGADCVGPSTQACSTAACPTGTLSATSCTIPGGSSTCNSSVTWNSDPTAGPTEVTRDNPSSTHVSSFASGTSVGNTVNYGPSNYYLYQNIGGVSTLLAYANINASCASGSYWNGSYCKNTPSSIMSGTLLPASSSCIIPLNGNSCNISFTWNTLHPADVSAVTSGYPVTNTTVATGNSNSTGLSVLIPYSYRTLYLYNNMVELARSTVTSSCASGTYWNGSLCAAIAACQVIPDSVCQDPNANNPGGALPCTYGAICDTQGCVKVQADKTTIVSGDSTILRWQGSGTCSSNFDLGGSLSSSKTISPTSTTTYTLSCLSGGTSSVTVIVNKRPTFKEN